MFPNKNTRKGVFFYIRPQNFARLAAEIMRNANIKPRTNTASKHISISCIYSCKDNASQSAGANPSRTAKLPTGHVVHNICIQRATCPVADAKRLASGSALPEASRAVFGVGVYRL